MPGWAGRKAAPSPLLGSEVVRVLVGPQQQEFTVHRNLLCASSAYFRESVEAIPAALASSLGTPEHEGDDGLAIWLAGESPQMFELFVLWLYQRQAFRGFMDEAIAALAPEGGGAAPQPETGPACRALRWNLVRLHLFAVLIDAPALQDVAMDALQDLYLRRDWDVSPQLVSFLYAECDGEAASRLRKWAITMVAWTLANAGSGDAGGPAASHFRGVFHRHPGLRDDYNAHLGKMAANRTNMRVKNPQLRIPGNGLRSEERAFGFRQCSFHSHRKVVGEAPCPHRLASRMPALPSPSTASESESEVGASASAFEGPILSPLHIKYRSSFLDLD